MLELYMKQNHENVERAESELNTLHEDMEQTLELQRRLAQRASLLEKEKKELEEALQKRSQEFQSERSSLQTRIDTLVEDIASRQDLHNRSKALQAELEEASVAKQKLEEQLRNYSNDSESVKRQAEEYKNELDRFIAKEHRDTLVENKGKKVQLRRWFRWFQQCIKEKSALMANEDAATVFAKCSCSKRGMRALRLATRRAAKIRNSEKRRGQACLQDCWRAWRLSTLAKRKYFGTLEHKNRTCKCRMMFKWRKAVQMGKLSDVEEKSLTNAACRHWSDTIRRRVLTYWLQWVLYWARPKHLRLKGLQCRLHRLTCKQVICGWQSLVRARRCKRLRLSQGDTQRRRWLQIRALNRWKSATISNKRGRKLNSRGLAFYKLHQYQTIIHTWKGFIHLKRNEKLSKTMAFRHYLHVLKSKGVSTWRKNVKFQRAEERAIHQMNYALCKASLSLWQDYHAAHAIKKRKELKALINCSRRDRKVARSLFLFWWEETVARKLALRLAYRLAAQRMHAKIRSSLKAWLHAAFGHVLVSNLKLQNDLLDSKAQFEDQKEQTNVIDVENLQLIDRLHSLSSEIAMLKLTINEKEKQEEDLHRALEDGALIESSMQGELDLQRAHVQELQLELFKLQRKLQKKNIEDTEGEVHHTMATQKLQRALKDLQRQLSDKTLQLNAYEKALKETAEKLEGASDESHEKLSSAFKIAASLRKLLEDRETQYATLEGTCRRKELELGEVQKKLDVVHSKFCETVEARDSRIHELENLLAQKQAESQEAQTDLQEMKVALSNRECLVRKLEYEIKLKSDRESHIARTFISGLSSLSSPRTHHVDMSFRSSFQHQEPTKLSKSIVQQQQQRQRGGLEETIYTEHAIQAAAVTPFAFITKMDSQDETPSSRSSKQADRAQQNTSDASRGGDEVLSSASSSSSEDGLGSHDNGDDDRPESFSTRADWDTSFALVSTAPRPATAAGQETPQYVTTESSDLERQEQAPRVIVDEDPRAVNGLHAEIQRLQARIMNRLRDTSPGQSEVRKMFFLSLYTNVLLSWQPEQSARSPLKSTSHSSDA
ncbi:myosin-7B-like isoform X1 [Selaginella moellendorffii]|uniref:myosin-7B-like isoform X1 n=2 Tax=Selaginella moellendorffii TaxID=88036 RepID=UPI000D1CDD21|nr:myosin-7B-like isoform X1 [Selaginella moellendorffii]|eukprot:XP_024542541.1 myosin-7B-like isoform X1 [Selaginella moellendorffii]